MIKERDFDLAQERIYSVAQKNEIVRNYLLLYKADRKNSVSVSLAGQRLFLYLVSKIKPDATKFDGIRIEIKSFCELIGIKINGKNYRDFRDAVDSLWNASFIEIGAAPPREIRILSYRTQMGESDPGVVELKLNEDLRPYLLNLANNYTQFSLHNVLRMKSQYGVKLYQLLRSYVFTGPAVRFSLDDLKGNLDATQYANLKDFKARVLTPALKDINTYSDLAVSVEYEKTGRTTTHVIFTLHDLEKPRTEEDAEEAQRRYSNVEQEINPDQLIIDDFPEATP